MVGLEYFSDVIQIGSRRSTEEVSRIDARPAPASQGLYGSQ
jgi:hypothetical protein